jgi:hypothetical protein
MNANLPSAARPNVLHRAIAASASLVLVVATATGIFVTKIARSYAANDGSAGTVEPQNDDGFGGFGGGQLSPPQDQPPAGRSHGS